MAVPTASQPDPPEYDAKRQALPPRPASDATPNQPPEDVPTSSASRRDPYLPALLLIVLLAVGLRLFLLFAAHATEEDFYITLRYVENIANGVGFVYNPGARVLGTTTPLYTLALALFMKLGLDPLLWGKLLSIAAEGLACWFTYRLGKAIGRPGVGLAAALCLAVAPTNLIWATKGMEVGIVAATAVFTWMAWAEKREIPAWIGASLLVLLRIDGAALAFILLLASLVRTRRLPWRGLLAFAALLAPWLLYATLTFGSPVPVSLQAKLIVYGRLAGPGFPYLRPFLTLMTHNPLGAFLMLGLLLYPFGVIWRCLRAFYEPSTSDPEEIATTSVSHSPDTPRPFRWPKETLLLAPLAWITLYYSGMALSKVYLFGWYFVPPTPIYYLVGILGWTLSTELLQSLGVGVWKWLYALFSGSKTRSAMAVLASSILLSLLIVPRVLATLKAGQNDEESLRIPIGLWLREHSAPTDSVMLEPIGYIGYFSRLPVVDMVGLVSPEVLPFYDRRIPSPNHAIWQQLQPTWILWRGGQLKELREYEASLPPSERLDAHYTQITAWPEGTGSYTAPAVFTLYRRK
jgi:hypothetical protein